MLWLRGDDATARQPASSRLTALMGSSDPGRRGPDTLRSTLGAPNRIFGCVHGADEPLDIHREAAILFDEPTAAALFAPLGQAVRHER
jgi:nucleoside diphosphate kinase